MQYQAFLFPTETWGSRAETTTLSEVSPSGLIRWCEAPRNHPCQGHAAVELITLCVNKSANLKSPQHDPQAAESADCGLAHAASIPNDQTELYLLYIPGDPEAENAFCAADYKTGGCGEAVMRIFSREFEQREGKSDIRYFHVARKIAFSIRNIEKAKREGLCDNACSIYWFPAAGCLWRRYHIPLHCTCRSIVFLFCDHGISQPGESKAAADAVWDFTQPAHTIWIRGQASIAW